MTIRLNGIDKEFDLYKISEINLSNTDREFIYFEKKNGDWIMNYTANTIPDLSQLQSIELVRIKE